jgi:hypothetical protein
MRLFLPSSASGLVSLSPIDAALIELGGVVDGAHVRFGKWPVQILTDANALVAEAIRTAVSVDFRGTPTQVFRPEYLCAIALRTGQAKDYLRVKMFLDQGSVEAASLS